MRPRETEDGSTGRFQDRHAGDEERGCNLRRSDHGQHRQQVAPPGTTYGPYADELQQTNYLIEGVIGSIEPE